MKILKLFPALAAFAILLTSCTLTITPEEAQPKPVPQTQPGRTVTAQPEPTRPVTSRPVPQLARDQVLEYNCDGGRLLVRYSGDETAQVYHSGAWQTLTLTSHTRGYYVYSSEHYNWFARGNGGYLEWNGAVSAGDCSL